MKIRHQRSAAPARRVAISERRFRRTVVGAVSAAAFVMAFSVVASAVEWEEIKGDHFIVYYQQSSDFTRDVLDKAEAYYRQIASELGYQRYSEFWTWDKRVKIFIYPDHDSFLKATDQPGWSQGMADYRRKEIVSYAWSKGFVESLLPHEMAHLIFRDFVGFKGEIPLWLDEGVAQWSEPWKRPHAKELAKQAYEDDGLLTLDAMMKLNVQTVTDKNQVFIRATKTKKGDHAVLFMSAESLVRTYYIEAVSIVGFLIEKYGVTTFTDFCKQLRDGKTMDEAFRFAYPTYIRDLADLETKWREYLAEGGGL